MITTDFDPTREAVIEPWQAHPPIEGMPEICIGVFSHKIVDTYVEQYHAEAIGEFKFCTGHVPLYKINIGGREFALFVPHVGAPAAGSMLEELIALGGKYFVFFGSCGVLRHDIADGHLILPTAAVRDEGLSYHYIEPSDEIALNPEYVELARKAMESLGLPYVETKTWTTDAFYRETAGKIAKRKQQGCACVEMECAALAAVAQFRGVPFVQFLYAADNLDAPEWDARGLASKGESGTVKYMTAAVAIGNSLRCHGQQ